MRSVQVGSEFEVKIAETPSTGYLWAMVEDPSVELVGRSWQSLQAPARNPEEYAVGGAGIRTFKLRAKAAGRVSLTFELIHPWLARSVQEPARTHIEELNISPAVEPLSLG